MASKTLRGVARSFAVRPVVLNDGLAQDFLGLVWHRLWLLPCFVRPPASPFAIEGFKAALRVIADLTACRQGAQVSLVATDVDRAEMLVVSVSFDHVPDEARWTRTPRDFIAGDACHIHSPETG